MKRVETEPIVVLERSEQLPVRERKRERRKRSNSVTTKGVFISGQIWTLMHNTDAVVYCKEDRILRSESSGI